MILGDDRNKRLEFVKNQAIKRGGTVKKGTLTGQTSLLVPYMDTKIRVLIWKDESGWRYTEAKMKIRLNQKYDVFIESYMDHDKFETDLLKYMGESGNVHEMQIGNHYFDNKFITFRNENATSSNLLTEEIQNKLLEYVDNHMQNEKVKQFFTEEFSNDKIIVTVKKKKLLIEIKEFGNYPEQEYKYDWLIDTIILMYNKLKELKLIEEPVYTT